MDTYLIWVTHLLVSKIYKSYPFHVKIDAVNNCPFIFSYDSIMSFMHPSVEQIWLL